MGEKRTRLFAYMTALALLGLDQLTKLIAIAGLELHSPVRVAGDLLRFTLAWNQGAAFSLSWGGPLFLTAVTAAAAVFVTVLIWRTADRPRVFAAGLSFILGGALGNLMDRLLYGKVLDFIDIGVGSTRWPTFNVADIAITIGGLLLIIVYRKDTRNDRCSDGGV